MPATQSDYDQIEAARNKVSALTKQAGDTQASALSFRDDVMKGVREARAARGITNLQEDFGNATERLAVGRSQIVDRNKGVLNPLTINQVTDQERAQNLGTLAKISSFEEQNAGTIEESVQAGANTVQAQATRIKAQADAAATELQNLMDVVKQKQAEAQAALENTFREKQFTESVRQADRDFALRAKTAGGGTKEPDKYGDNDITRAAGLVGMPITPENNEKIAYEQYLANERGKKANTAAQIKAAEDANLVYDPRTDSFTEKPKSWWQKLTRQ